jgi:hypothetical protein
MIFQQQPTPDTCTSACLAMITGKPVEQVIAEYDAGHKSHELNANLYLIENGIDFCHGGIHEQMRSCGLFLLCVPSLNIVGGLHNILCLIWQDGDLFYKQIFDPCMGREGRKYYTMAPPENDLQFNLYSYIVEATILDYKKYID